MKSFIITACVALLLFGNVLMAQDTAVYKTTKITDGIYEMAADGGGYPVKVIASVGDDGLLIVDSGEEENGEALVEALKTFNKGLPKIIINTHSHIEHLGGNIAIGAGRTIIGHKNLRDRYINGLYLFNEFPDSVLPNVTFTNSLSVFFNGEEIKLIAFPGAHDNSDIIVWFTKSNVVCTGALCNGSHFPSIDGELGNILLYAKTVENVMAILPPDINIIPGHGADCTMKEYRQFHDMLLKTSDIIRNEIRKGNSLVQMQEDTILADWKSWELYVDCDSWIEYFVNAIQHPKVVSSKKKMYAPLYHTIKSNGVEAGIALYRDLKTRQDEYQYDERTAMYVGRRLAFTGHPDDAIKFLNVCLTEYPNTDAAAISQYTIGNIYWNKKEMSKAKEYYQYYLERFPRNETVRERLKEIEKGE